MSGAFASRAQAVVILLLLVSWVLIAQQGSIRLYQVGLLSLLLLTVVQIALGNVRPTADLVQTSRAVGITVFTLGALIVLAIYLVPYLTNLGR